MNSILSGRLGFISVLVGGVILTFVLPLILGMFGLVQAIVFISMSVLALSLGFVWGFGGIMCFGQSTFFGIGGYAYAVAAENFGGSTWAVILSMLVPAAVAALLGYFMFYGRISDTYIGVITLTVTVILFSLVNSTSGPQYNIGNAELGGFNGMPSVPAINFPGSPSALLPPSLMFTVSMATLMLTYAGLRVLLGTKFGRVLVAIRENETRAMLLGYDSRWYKTIAFTVGGGIAGLGGCLFTNWGGFISPAAFSIAQAAQIIIFVLVGGIGTLLGPILGALAVEYLITMIGTQQVINADLILGTIFIGFVLLVPQGVVPTMGTMLGRYVLLNKKGTLPPSARPAPTP